MIKISLLSNFLKLIGICALLTACQTTPVDATKDEPTPLEEQQMRDSVVHGPQEHIVPIFSKTYNMEQETDATEE